ncbi:MAG: hypothetical protein M1833_005951 [Piccolia ochrophora]|nr:MAG: hypothetical protein M1833_005951 [Piccolia ochrophora]
MALQLSRAAVSEWQDVANLLHLAFHHNKNQFRSAAWWKWFAMLKRSVQKLPIEILAREAQRVDVRICHLREVLIPQCYTSFLHLVADEQFCVVGLVLLATLARLDRILGPRRHRRGQTRDQGTRLAAAAGPPGGLPGVGSGSEDLGEPVARPVAVDHPTIPLVRESSVADLAEQPTSTTPRKRKLSSFSQPRDGDAGPFAPTRAMSSYLQGKSVKRQMTSASSNTIDILFRGLTDG